MAIRRSLLFLLVLAAVTLHFVHLAVGYLILAALGVLALVAEVLENRMGRRARAGKPRSSDPQSGPRVEDLAADLEASSRKISRLESDLALLEEEREAYGLFRDEALGHLAEYCLVVDVLKKMQESVIQRTETSTMQVTDTIFAIGERSKKVGGTIQEMLKEMTIGDQSLSDDVDRVMAEVRRFGEMGERFRALERGYLEDMRTIEETVRGVLRFTGDIADLADQTSILAINASIEAARVGDAGRGFAVIAGEVQALSKKSKDISETIGQMFRETAETVDHSLEHQTTRIREAVGALEVSRDELGRVSSALEPQVKLLESTVETARGLSEEVTDELEKVTVSLQFQDAVRQILEHVLHYQEDLKEKYRSIQDLFGVEFPDDDAQFKARVEDALSRYFTTREEWGAAGVVLEERVEGAEEAHLKGDVTLF